MSFSFKKLYLVILIFTLLASSFNLNKVFADTSNQLPLGSTLKDASITTCSGDYSVGYQFKDLWTGSEMIHNRYTGTLRHFSFYFKNLPSEADSLKFTFYSNLTGNQNWTASPTITTSLSSVSKGTSDCQLVDVDLGSDYVYDSGTFQIDDLTIRNSSNASLPFTLCGSYTAPSTFSYSQASVSSVIDSLCNSYVTTDGSPSPMFYPFIYAGDSVYSPVAPSLSVTSVLSPLNNDVIETGDFYLQFQLSNIPSGYHFYSADVYLVPSTGYDLPTYQLFYFGTGSYVSTGGVLNVPISGLPDNGYVIGILNVKYIEDWVQVPYVPDYKTASYDGSAVQFVVNNSGVAGPPVINTEYPLPNISLDSVCDANQLTSAELVTCRAVAWLFLPTDSTIVRFYEASTYFSSKAPFRYVKELWGIVNDETNVTSESLPDFSVNIPLGDTTLNVPTLTSTTFSDVFGSSTWLLINNFLRAGIYVTIIVFVIISIMNFV